MLRYAGFWIASQARNDGEKHPTYKRTDCIPIILNLKYNIHFFVNYNKSTIFAPSNRFRYMIVTFDKEYLQELYEKGKTTDKKFRFQPEVIDGYVKGIYKLEISDKIEDYTSTNH